jgi:hypothetical protein
VRRRRRRCACTPTYCICTPTYRTQTPHHDGIREHAYPASLCATLPAALRLSSIAASPVPAPASSTPPLPPVPNHSSTPPQHVLAQHVEQRPNHKTKLRKRRQLASPRGPPGKLAHLWPVGPLHRRRAPRQRLPGRWRQGERLEGPDDRRGRACRSDRRVLRRPHPVRIRQSQGPQHVAPQKCLDCLGALPVEPCRS